MESSLSVLELGRLQSKEDCYLRRLVSLTGSGDGVDIVMLRSLSHVEPLVPFRVVPFPALRELGRIPRSNEGKTRLAAKMPPGTKVAFLSHRWLRPWATREETEANGREWAGAPHPDDESNSKFRLLVDGIECVARDNNWAAEELAVWIDFTCIDQDDAEKRKAGVSSLLGYMSRCKFVIIPSLEPPSYTTVHRMPGDYGKRAWTRLEALAFYVLSLLGNLARPELYFTSPDGQVGCLDYVLLPYTMPSAGYLHQEGDRTIIRKHEQTCLDVLHSSALHGSQAAVGPDMVAAAGLGEVAKLEALLAAGVDVDVQDNSGITALWSASRQGHQDIVEMLVGKEASVDLAPDSGLAPVHCAALEGHIGVLRVLLANGASVDCQDREGQTPLVWAALRGRADCVMELLRGGASDVSTALLTVKELGARGDAEVLGKLQQATLISKLQNEVGNRRIAIVATHQISENPAKDIRVPKQLLPRVEAALRRARRWRSSPG